MTETIFWHDYETTGADVAWDRPVQFAGIRTDLDLVEIDEPVEFFCKPNSDCVPHPEAVLITRITPQIAEQKGSSEAEFCRLISEQVSRPETCSVGYNSIRFDDEVTRNLLYRNFYDPYAREWRDGNSRWDLIDVVRLVAALRPEGIEWPLREDGQPSFRLELLTAANGIEHSGAHDAVADVRATIALARLIKQKQPDLFQYCWKLRRKAFAASQLDVANHKPFLHISSKIPASRHCAALMAPLIVHPRNPNGVVALDLSCDPQQLLEYSVDELHELLYQKRPERVEGENAPERVDLGLNTIHINKSPMLVTSKVLTPELNEKLQIDRQQAEKHWRVLLDQPQLLTKVKQIFDRDFEPSEPTNDPELMIYDGFLSNRDRELADRVLQSTPEELAQHSWSFEDERMTELLVRYRARNWPETLSAEESAQWAEFCSARLFNPWRKGALSVPDAIGRSQQLRAKKPEDETTQKLLQELEIWLQRFHEAD